MRYHPLLIHRAAEKNPSRILSEQSPSTPRWKKMARPVVKPKESISASLTMERYIAHHAIEDICWLYMDRDLADYLRRLSWREARRRVLRQGPLYKEWVSHRDHPPVRLTRRGVEVRLEDGVWLFGWERMQAQIRARRY